VPFVSRPDFNRAPAIQAQNPVLRLHRDLNRIGQRMLWNAILDRQSILAAPAK